MYCVYKHTTPNGKVYIGITSLNPMRRWRDGIGYKEQVLFYNAIQKYSWENIKHEILFENLTKEEAYQKEIELIAKYKSNDPKFGYNLTSGGENCEHCEESRKKMSESHKGKQHSDETKRRLSEIASNKIGKLNPFYGRCHSNETRKKMSKSHKGKPSAFKGKHYSEETCKKMSEIASKRTGKSNGFYGRHHSEETKQKIRDAHKRRKELSI